MDQQTVIEGKEKPTKDGGKEFRSQKGHKDKGHPEKLEGNKKNHQIDNCQVLFEKSRNAVWEH